MLDPKSPPILESSLPLRSLAPPNIVLVVPFVVNVPWEWPNVVQGTGTAVSNGPNMIDIKVPASSVLRPLKVEFPLPLASKRPIARIMHPNRVLAAGNEVCVGSGDFEVVDGFDCGRLLDVEDFDGADTRRRQVVAGP